MLPIHLALLNVIEIEFGRGGAGGDVAEKQRLVLPQLKKYCELLQLLSLVKSTCVHVTVN